MIFVDDLERSRPPRALEVCEIASQLLGHDDVVIVLIADMGVIAASAEIKYAALENSASLNGRGHDTDAHRGEYGRFYLQKMVQIQFDLPPARYESLQSMLREEMVAAPDAEEGAPQPSPSPRGRQRVRRRVANILARLTAEDLLPKVMAAVAAGVAVQVALANSFAKGGVPSTELSAAIIGVFVATFAGLSGWLISASRAKETERVDDEIKRQVETGTEDVEKLVENVTRKGFHEDLVRQRSQRIVTDESSLRREAESEASRFLPPLPRSAKRMTNHLRLLLTVASTRRMFGGRPRLNGPAPWEVGRAERALARARSGSQDGALEYVPARAAEQPH